MARSQSKNSSSNKVAKHLRDRRYRQIVIKNKKAYNRKKHEEHGHTKILINEKQIELIKNQIQELKERSDNPLAG